MMHYTLTGPYCSQTLCGAKHIAGDDYAHYTYAPSPTRFKELGIALCPECERVWNEAEAETEAEASPVNDMSLGFFE